LTVKDKRNRSQGFENHQSTIIAAGKQVTNFHCRPVTGRHEDKGPSWIIRNICYISAAILEGAREERSVAKLMS